MEADDWAALPKLGTRVLVPHLNAPLEGEIVLHHRLFGRPVARVKVQVPIRFEPYETHTVTMIYRPEAMKIISDEPSEASAGRPAAEA